METQNVKVCYVVNTNEEVKSIYKIDDTPDKRNDARDQVATAFSAYSYSFYPERWKEEPVRYGDLSVCIYDNDDAEKAFEYFKSFIEIISSVYDINPDIFRYVIPAIIDTTLLFQHGPLEVKMEIFICLEYIEVWFLKC